MKKLITLVMLSILTVINASAAETILWEGDWWISWEAANTDESHKGVSIPDVTSFADNQVMYIYLAKETTKIFEADYHNYRFDADWTGLAEADDLTEDYARIQFVVTPTVKTALEGKTFNIHGHGVRVLRVTKEVTDCPTDIKWVGEKNISQWSGEENRLSLSLKNDLGITSACNIYMLVEDITNDLNSDGSDLRIVASDWSKHLPFDGYNHLQNRDVNNIVTVELTAEFLTAVESMNTVFWGNKISIKAISTSKDAILQLTKGLIVNVDANGYATFSSSWNLDLANLPDGLEAYTATLAGKTLSFTQKDEAVAAETGLLLKGTAWYTYKVPVTTVAGATIADNALKSVVTATTLQSDASNYIFVMKKATSAGTLTFQKLSTTGVTMPANKAYVQVSPSVFTPPAHALSISCGEGGVTGISEATLLNINEVIKNNNVYDLSGRRVAKPTKGLYIVNGKKVVIK